MSYFLSDEEIYNKMKVGINNVDTSENSYIYNALYPSAMELSYCLLAMDDIEQKVFASKAVKAGYSDYLDLRVNEVGLTRKLATYAKPIVTFTGKVGMIISQGSIVSTSDNRLYKTITDVTIGTNGTVDCIVIANDSGSLYNVKTGQINYLPIKYNGITSVTNVNDYNDAYDKETDEALYNRYLLKIRKLASSGNIADYEEWCLSVTGVGSVTVYPIMDENLNKKKGHVTCVIINSNNEPASDTLIQAVQDYISPTDENGEGEAPIGASVHIITPLPLIIDISANIIIDTSLTTLDNVKKILTDNLVTYFKGTVFTTKKIVYKKIEAILMNINGVNDCSNLKINNDEVNIPLTALQLASVGNINLVQV